MNKNSKIVLGVVLVLAILLVAVGYAAIQTVNLKIESSSAQATPNQSNFTVKFTGTPTTGGVGTTTATIDENDELKASMNVTGLTAKGDTATATFEIENTSADLSAALSVAEPITNSNTSYFDVSYNIADPVIGVNETKSKTTITVTVELIKTPITQDETTTIGLTINADPQQPTSL